ncbi:MAG: N-acetyltransferase [Alphaproteobacteria bacterium]|nr:N-acetyltransferase [Alphaproteobacteria bacterium]
MPEGDTAVNVTAVHSIARIDRAAWDACAASSNPFVSHAFLDCLEQSGSASANTGWSPCHLTVQDSDGTLAACAPLYLKSHSYGEYVFDWAWAEAYGRIGGQYYPKLQCAVPFTPVAGPRLMVRPGRSGRATLAAAMVQLASDNKLSSAHVTFTDDGDIAELEAAGFMTRLGYQYHWTNRGYGRFDDFLADLASRRRKQIRKERDAVARSGLTIRTLVGADIQPFHWDHFLRLVHATARRKWGQPYLTRAFFEALSASTLGAQVVLVWAEQDGRPVAAAFNMIGGDTLYGRTWGADTDTAFLHFEACYYRAIDFALAHGLARVEAGAQGEHKLGRGYLPVPTRSAHWIADRRLAEPVARFLAHETPLVAADMALQEAAGPYRQT